MQKVTKALAFRKMPKLYRDTLKIVVDSISQHYGDNLENILLNGSAGRCGITEGWSDLDIYIITKRYSLYDNTLCQAIITNAGYKIHIGTSFFTLNDIIVGNVDKKTKVALYNKKVRGYNPFLLGNCNYYDVSFNEIINMDNMELNNTLQTVTRELSEYMIGRIEFRKFLKDFTKMLKQFLRPRGYNPASYVEVFEDINNMFKGRFKVDILKIIKENDKDHSFKQDAFYILSEIMKVIQWEENQ